MAKSKSENVLTLAERIDHQRERIFDAQAIVSTCKHGIDPVEDHELRRSLEVAIRVLDYAASDLELIGRDVVEVPRA